MVDTEMAVCNGRNGSRTFDRVVSAVSVMAEVSMVAFVATEMYGVVRAHFFQDGVPAPVVINVPDSMTPVRNVYFENSRGDGFLSYSSRFPMIKPEDNFDLPRKDSGSCVPCGDNYVNRFVNSRARDTPMYHRQEARHYARKRDRVSNVRKRI